MRVHFIGIGGIGVSALARYYLEKGHEVSGSDLVASEITESLKKLGAKICIRTCLAPLDRTLNTPCVLRTCLAPLGRTLKASPVLGKHKAKSLPKDTDLVIYSPAIGQDNPELIEAKRDGTRILSYPQALGELTKQYFTIAVSGTHGKSTTTAMIGLLLFRAGLDPTVIVGTKLKEFGNSNFRMGKNNFSVNQRRRLWQTLEQSKTFQPPSEPKASDQRKSALKTKAFPGNKPGYLVIEADEHFASFLNYWPKIIVLTNIEKEHLDYYKNLNNILKTYGKYIRHLPKDGILIANRDDKNTLQITKKREQKTKTLFYSLKQPEAKKLRKTLKIPGEHNVYNALSALTLARALKIPDKISLKSLSEYKGAWRRFELSHAELRRTKRGTTRKITIISDYGHHPTEIKVTLKAAREKFPQEQIWCVFQPHQYQRTFYLFNDFVRVFREAPVDKLLITDIYDVVGREEKKIKEKVNSQKLVKAIGKKAICGNQISAIYRAHNPLCATVYRIRKPLCATVYLPREKIIDYLKKNLQGGEVVIIMGAGDIYDLTLGLTGRK